MRFIWVKIVMTKSYVLLVTQQMSILEPKYEQYIFSFEEIYLQILTFQVRRYSPTCYRRGPSLIQEQSVLELWWIKWHWDRFLLRGLRVSPVSTIPHMLHTC
jgi:hypothetical protein